MLSVAEPNIRELITFLMNQQAIDMMIAALTEVPLASVRELHIRLALPQARSRA